MRPGDKLFAAGDDWHLNAHIAFEHPSFIIYANGYRKAAEALVEAAINDLDLLDSCIFPIVFLYRHYVELRLKEVILYTNGLLGKGACFPTHHNLLQLWHERKKTLTAAGLGPSNKTQLADEQIAESLVQELTDSDSTSFAFRYPVDKGRNPAMPQIRLMNIRILKETMERLGNFLDAEVEYVLVALQSQPNEEDWY